MLKTKYRINLDMDLLIEAETFQEAAIKLGDIIHDIHKQTEVPDYGWMWGRRKD